MSKLTFKRLASILVASLGLGLLSSGPSSGAFTASSDTLTLSATSATIATGETASVTISASAIAGAAADSLTVNVVTQSRPSGGDGSAGMYVTDSSNTRLRTSAYIPLGGSNAGTNWSGSRHYDDSDSAAVGVNVSAGMGSRKVADMSVGAGLVGHMGAEAAAAMSASFSFRFIAPTVAGTYVFRVYLTGTGSYAPVTAPLTYTVTVTANTSTIGDAAKSQIFLNRTTEFTTSTGYAANPSTTFYRALEADSSLVVSAGTAASPAAVGVLTPVLRNSSDTKVATLVTYDGSTTSAGSLRVKDSVTVVISGPGLLGVHNYWTGLTSVTRAKQVTADWKESIVVYSDGTAGTATITSYEGSSVAANAVFTQAAKSITFVGRATTFTVTGYSAAQRAGGTVSYITDAGVNDSVTAGGQLLRFLATDSAGNAVTSAALSIDQGQGAFWAMSSDTSVVAATPVGSATAAAITAARRTPYLPCTYDSTSSVAGYWYCDGAVYDSGTVTLTIVDSRTVTPNGSNYVISTTSGVNRSAAFSVTIVGKGSVGTIALDKSAYKVNEAATLTLTCTDIMGRTVADRANTCFTNLAWTGSAPTFNRNTTLNAAGGTFGTGGTSGTNSTLIEYLTAGNSFTRGTDTAMVFMPATAGTYTLTGRTGTETADKTLLTFTVSDPVQDAQNAAIAASQAAADAATDAALEAIDAANAATDAANLAAEAADAATVAAEEARDAADAATAAVEALATEVATLMAALKAQITTLARTVAKIAKKVNA
jgi:hypothetical protein